MKKYLSLLLALVMILAMFAGCGNSDDADNISGTILENENEETEEVTEEITEEETEEITEEVTEEATEEVTEEATETASEEESNLSLGRIEGGIYVNNYAGFACELSDSWAFYTAEELQELPASVSDAMSGSELGDAMANYTQFFDMSAENVDELLIMNVVYNKLSLTERAYYATLSEDQIADQVLGQKDDMAAAYAQAGITLHSMEKVTVTFAGEERVAIYSVTEVQGIAYYVLQLFDYHCGEYSVSLTLGSYIDDNTGALLELFYAVE